MSIDDIIAADSTDYDAIFNAEQNRSPNAMFEAEYIITPQALLMQLEQRSRYHQEMVRQHDGIITTLHHRATVSSCHYQIQFAPFHVNSY